MAGLARNPCVDAAGNNGASCMLLHDVAKLRGFFGRFVPELLHTDFGLGIWDLYQQGRGGGCGRRDARD